FVAEAVTVPDLKAVFGRVESYEVAPARARIGGTILSLSVAAGSAVNTGQVLAIVGDEKLALQMQAIEARLKGLEAQLENARVEYER
ncbi:biotin/lipoyl-binding protein, partial [Vibrio vulnificus]|uniref:biotin/lipoyl-binding protein n=1 Tax=Vibrio vulnificus TaxID=672 RepID=UPI0019D449DA